MLVFWAIYQSPNKPIEQQLKDGSILRLEKVTHGRRHSFERGPFRTAWLRGLLPFLPFKSSFAISSSSSQDSLVLWLSRRDPQTGAELDCDWLATATAVLAERIARGETELGLAVGAPPWMKMTSGKGPGPEGLRT
jgi:hypothetical protein